jgi:hypothetical protein
LKWLTLLRHHKVKLAISSRAGEVHLDGTASSGVLRPFPRRKGGKQQTLEEEVHHAAPHAGEGHYIRSSKWAVVRNMYPGNFLTSCYLFDVSLQT